MNTINEEIVGQQPVQAPKELLNLDSSVMSSPDAATAEFPAQAPAPTKARKRTPDKTLKEAGRSNKPKRVSQRKGGEGEQLPAVRDSKTSAVKPARAKQAQKQSDSEETKYLEHGSRLERTLSRRPTREAENRTEARSDANGIPALTPLAIEYLGKKNATLSDYIKLDAESMSFVRYHLKRMHKLEADGLQATARAGVKTQPVSPALQRFANARQKDLERDYGNVHMRVAGKPTELSDQAQIVANPSYGPGATDYPSYASVVVQLRNFDLSNGKAGQAVQPGEVTLDDNQRTQRVLRTTQILTAASIGELAPGGAAELVAGDIKEVRAIEGALARHLALSAMHESGLSQPRYRSEFARQAPDLVEAAKQAHRGAKADQGMAYEVISTLSNFMDSQVPLTDAETIVLARRTTMLIRAIEIPQYREEALAISHQAGLLHSLYRAAFANNAPELVTTAEVAYMAQESKTTTAGGSLYTDENSIEKSPVLPVRSAESFNHGNDAKMEEPEVSEGVERQAAVSVAFDNPALADAAERSSLGRRLLLAMEGAKNYASTWLSTQRIKGLDVENIAPTSTDRPEAMPVQPIDKLTAIPESVVRRFLRVETEYYFLDRTPAFSDRGSRLATRGANREVVLSMVEIAIARGWDTITVKGSEEFRRSAWIEAAQKGLVVTGYKPTSLDLSDLANRPANNAVEKGEVRNKGNIQTPSTVPQSLAQTNIGQPDVDQGTAKERAPVGPQTDPELAAKAKAFEEGKPTSVVRKYPDLAAAYGIVAAAKAFASEKLPEASRNGFVEMARRHMVEKITAGQQIHGPKIYLEPTKTVDVGKSRNAEKHSDQENLQLHKQ